MGRARAGSGHSDRPDPLHAAREATVAALAHLDLHRPGRGCDAAVLVAAGAAAARAPEVAHAVREVSGARMVVGCTAPRVHSDAGTTEEGVGVLLLRGTEAEVAVAREAARDPAGAGRALGASFARLAGRQERPLLWLWADPDGLRTAALLEALADHLPPGVPVAGGLAGRPGPGAPPATFPAPRWRAGPREGAVRGAACGLLFRGARGAAADLSLAPPRAGNLRVTRAEGRVLAELDGVAALARLRGLLGDAVVGDLGRLQREVLLARRGGDAAELLPVAGVLLDRLALVLGAPARPGELLRVAPRDPDAARRAVPARLAELEAALPAEAALGLAALPDEADALLADALRRARSTLPWVGWATPMAVQAGAPRPLAAVVALFA